ARAVTTPVHATGTLNLGLHREGDADPKPAEIAYTNPTGTPVTVDLAAELSNLDHPGDASDAIGLGTDRLTVPAGATVTVPVTVDLDRLERGKHAGRITATGPDGTVARTTVSGTLAGPTHTVTFRAVAADGSPTGMDLVMLRGLDRRTDQIDGWVGEQGTTFQVEEGTYHLTVLVMDFDRQFEQSHLLTDPEFEITGEQDEVVLDVGDTVPVEIETPKPSEQRAIFSYYTHRVMPNGRAVSHGVMHFSVTRQVNVTPTDPVSGGEFEFSSRWQLVAPMVDAQVQGVTGPLDINLLHQSPTFDDRRQFRLVFAGTGTPAELADAPGVRGAAVVLTGVEDRSEQEQIVAAAAAGAAAVLIVRAADFPPWTVWRPNGDREPIPAMVVGHPDGQRIIERIRDRSGRLSLKLTVDSPYLYDVFHVETGRVPDRIVHRVTPANSARFQVGYTDLGGFGWLKEQRFGWRPWQDFAWNDYQRFLRAGQTREEWVSAGDSLWQHRVQHEYTWDDMNPLLGGMTEAPRSYRAGQAD
ncbi:MAG: peptidase S8, partial [Natronosporangium sp.]